MPPLAAQGAMGLMTNGIVRPGVQGGSSELLSPAQQRQVDDYFRTQLQRLGSEFCDVDDSSGKAKVEQ
jgi:hypothetical protein